MADVVNLNRFRKQKAKGEKENRARENRAKFGRTKADKEKDRHARERLEAEVDGHHREDPTDRPDD